MSLPVCYSGVKIDQLFIINSCLVREDPKSERVNHSVWSAHSRPNAVLWAFPSQLLPGVTPSCKANGEGHFRMVSPLGSKQALTNIGCLLSHHRSSRSRDFLVEGPLLGQVGSFSPSAAVGLGRGFEVSWEFIPKMRRRQGRQSPEFCTTLYRGGC